MEDVICPRGVPSQPAALSLDALVHPILGTVENIKGKNYDTILANINRNVLLDCCKIHHALLKEGGELCISGVLEDDEKMIVEAYSLAGFKPAGIKRKGEWVAILFVR